MLKYKDKNGIITPLLKYSDLYIEEVLEYGDKTLCFNIPIKYGNILQLEDFIITKEDEFVIKKKDSDDSGNYSITAQINIDELEGNAFQNFETVEQSALDTTNLALAGTGWSCQCDVKKKRTVRLTNVSVWEVLKKIADTFILEMQINSISKIIIFKEKIGEDKGVYFADRLNLISLETQSNTSEFYTRILPIGKDGLTIEEINDGSKFVENYTYSNKVKTCIWKDERYTNADSLKEDAAAKLADMAQPYTAYSCAVVNLEKQSNISYGVGDIVTIINKETHTRVQQRIVKIRKYPDNHSKDRCEISNTKLTFEKYAQKYQSTSETVDNITTDNGTVDGDCIDSIDASKVLNLDTVIANSAKFVEVSTQVLNVSDQLNAASAKIGALEATRLTATEADLKYATIDNLTAATGRIDTLEANALTSGSALIHSLTSDISKINTLMFGTASGESLTTEFSNSVVSLIGDAQIKSAMIQNIAADKITTGKLYTNLVEVCSQSGNLDIADNTILIKDDAEVARVQLGKDAGGDYNLYIWDKSGSLMFDALGLTESGIQREIIRNDMISENAAISASKLDITSLFTVINGSTETINSARVLLDADNQTLDIAFKQMSTQVNTLTETVSTQGTQLTAVQGQISSKIWQQDITTAVAELEIGGRNIFLNSGFNNETKYWYGYNATKEVVDCEYAVSGKAVKITLTGEGGLFTRKGGTVTETEQFNAGDVLILSGYIKGTAGSSVTLDFENSGAASKNVYPAEEWQYFTHCITVKKAFSPITFYGGEAGVTFYLKDLKLEYGNKATDWTPAPEDTEEDITALKETDTILTNQYTSLNQSLTSISVIVSSNTTAISQKADGSTVTALQSSLTTLQADLTGYKTTVSENYTTKTEFNSLQIGGRNLLLGTLTQDTEKGNYRQGATDTGETYKGCKVFKTSARFADIGFNFVTQVKNRNVVHAGDWVTYSIYAKTDDTADRYPKMFISGQTSYYVYDKTPTNSSAAMTENWQQYSYTIQITEEMLGDENYSTLWRFKCVEDCTEGAYIYWAAPKLETGTRATDYSAAPEDTDAAIADVDSKFANYSTTIAMNSAIEQKSSSILATVSATYATQDSLGSYATTQSVTASLALKIDKTDNSQIVSMINASADVIKLTADRFILDSTYSKINQDGSVSFTGGTIGGFTIDGNGLFNVQNGVGCGMQKFGQGSAFWAGAGGVGNGGESAEFKVWHDGSVFAQKLYITGGSINICDNFIVDAGGNLVSKGAADFQCNTVYSNDFHSRGSMYVASALDVGATIGCEDILVKNNAYVHDTFYYWYNGAWTTLRDYISAIINGG